MHEDVVTLSGLSPEKAQERIEGTFLSHRSKLLELDQRGATAAEKLGQAERMIDELRVAQAGMREAMALSADRELSGPQSELRSFVQPDGKVRLFGPTTDDGNADTTWEPGLLDSRATYGEWHGRLKELVSIRSVAKIIRDGRATPKIDATIQRHVERGPKVITRGLFGATGYGAEWIPTQMLVPDLDRAVVLMSEGTLAGIFREVPMSTKVLTVPYGTTGGTPYLLGDPAADPAQFTAQLPGSDSRTHTAKTMAMRYPIDHDSAEDAIVDTWGVLREQMAMDLTDGYEDALINGDTTATHQDTGIASWNPASRWGGSTFGTTADHRRGFIGLRARAFDVSSTLDLSAAQTFAGLMQLRGTKLQSRSRTPAIIVGEALLYTKMYTWSEIQTTLSTVSTVRDGRILTIGGMPLYTSLFMQNDQAATGLYTGSGTYASVLIVDTSRFANFRRRGTLIELDREASRGMTHMVGTLRGKFGTNDPAASGKNVALGFKLLS